MSGHGVVSKHSAAATVAATVADVVAGPIQKWIHNERNGEREKETMVTSDMSSYSCCSNVGQTRPHTYRGENKGLLVLLSRTQAGPGRTVKQEQ